MFSLVGVGAFFARPLVKFLGGALLIGLAVFLAVHQFHKFEDGLREEGRLKGRKEVTVEFQAIVDENNKVNRKVEQKVDDALGRFVGKLEDTLTKVRGDSAKIAGNVVYQIDKRPQIFANPVCDTPQDTIDSRNAIRALGPKQNAKPLPTQTGSSVTVTLPTAKEAK